MGRLRAEDLAPLLPDTPKRDRLAQQVVGWVGEWDWAIDDSFDGSLAPWKARQASGRARDLDAALRDNLSGLLTKHLRGRTGKPLSPNEQRVWLQLVARGIRTPGVQVCDGCGEVFAYSHSDARRCRGCWTKRAPKVYPARDGGRHLSIRALRDGTYEYITACTACGAEFPTKRADAERCPQCKSPTARSRLSRGRARSRASSDQ
jgi:hypothetical protein